MRWSWVCMVVLGCSPSVEVEVEVVVELPIHPEAPYAGFGNVTFVGDAETLVVLEAHETHVVSKESLVVVRSSGPFWPATRPFIASGDILLSLPETCSDHSLYRLREPPGELEKVADCARYNGIATDSSGLFGITFAGSTLSNRLIQLSPETFAPRIVADLDSLRILSTSRGVIGVATTTSSVFTCLVELDEEVVGKSYRRLRQFRKDTGEPVGAVAPNNVGICAGAGDVMFFTRGVNGTLIEIVARDDHGFETVLELNGWDVKRFVEGTSAVYAETDEGLYRLGVDGVERVTGPTPPVDHVDDTHAYWIEDDAIVRVPLRADR